ncbi:DUF2213 domain-containing protein [Xenorhabdus budapestensis]|uniref:DUF2213 domain-containing protein n=1 Tax=Xenorhabdus budapestensis TaxID=290110 RepID=A0ABX7VKH9_XENBU|nr:DUF2213 domain-containing protein [Xenorhabdus budapestensis]QTL40915.1 DUF2213 domain-containing protein [Xenorhabdus budapestensis]
MKYFFTTQLGETRYEMADGSLLCKDVPIARTGTQTYLPEEIGLEGGSDGLVTVHRMEDEVFSTATMASFEGVAVTLGHPEDADGNIVFVNPSNFSELAHGHIQNVRRGTGDKADLLIADALIKRQEAIDAVKAGITEVSCGYDAQYKQISPGKGKQYQITGNHLAIVDKGRAGSRCSIGDAAPTTKKGKTSMKDWLKQVANALKTKDDNTLAKLADNAPELPSDGMSSIPGVTINMNTPAQATALPTAERTTTDDTLKKENPTGDDGIPEWGKVLIAKVEALSNKTGDNNPGDPDKKTGDEDEEEDRKVTGDAAYRRNIIADAEIICPGFKPTGDKGLKRQVLNHAIRTGDSLKTFGVSDFAKAPKATVDAIFTAAVALNKAKNHIQPPTPTRDNAARYSTPAELNKKYAEFWKRN